MGRTLKDVMDGLEPDRRARIGARADEIHQEYLTLKKLRSHMELTQAALARKIAPLALLPPSPCATDRVVSPRAWVSARLWADRAASELAALVAPPAQQLGALEAEATRALLPPGELPVLPAPRWLAARPDFPR